MRSGLFGPKGDASPLGEACPLGARPDIDMDPRIVNAEAAYLDQVGPEQSEETRMNFLGCVVVHDDVRGPSLHVLRGVRPTDRAVVFGRAVTRDDADRVAEFQANAL